MAAETELTLHHGDLQFSALSQGDGPIVLCLHGFPDTLTSFRHQVPAFADAGYRAISVAMRGYEPQSIPGDGDYFSISVARDIIAFIDELGGEPVHLVGHDWGAIVSYVVASLAPEKLHSVTTIAVPELQRMASLMARSLKQMRNSWYIAFFQTGRVADYIVERNDFAFIDRLWRKWSPGWDAPAEELARVKHAFAQPGVKEAVLGYYRAFPKQADPRSQETQKLLAEPYQVPFLAMVGDKDGCINADIFEQAMMPSDFPAGLELHRIPNAGHFVHQEVPELVNPILIDWFGKNALV